MSNTSIWDVLNNKVVDIKIKRGIEIPMIQRDYAQGRNNIKAEEIRKVFLNNILSGINSVIIENKPPLELDFIYGYIESETFIPLDGQQRLTTLYLLHWYFAFKERLLKEYELPFSKFKYQTRQSSEDFLKKINTGLSSEDFLDIFEKNKTFKSVIRNKNWYFVNWKYDLTIQSCITMLDEIHLIFNASSIKFLELIDDKKPCIVFNFLDIKNFGLSDDLYIKMNSRGKPLTNFENLKAELGKFIQLSDFDEKYNYSLKHSAGNKKVNVESYFVTKIDTLWSDYFWDLRNNETNEFDDKLLNLLAFVSLNELIKVNRENFDVCIKDLDSNSVDLSYYKFKSLNLLNESTIISYIDILDLLVSENELIKTYLNDEVYLKKKSIISSSFENNFKAIYEQRIFFYAIFKFLIDNKNELEEIELKKWDRLISNLITNTTYNGSKDFQDSILSINRLLERYTGDIYKDFSGSDIKGFDSQQIKEEKLKIKLIDKSKNWSDFIHEAELHPYLNGQIMLLLDFSGIYNEFLEENINWTSNEDLAYFESIKLYYDKFKKTFSETGLREFKNELFRRALLVKGDYLLYSTNYSMLIDSHRDISWKRLFKETGNKTNKGFIERCKYLKDLFDDLDIDNVDKSLSEIIKNSNCTGWRKDLIDNPKLINMSYQKYLKFFENGDMYILRKSKYNKDLDPEVKITLLNESLIKNGFMKEEVVLGYISKLNQFGIIGIKSLKPKIVYNFNGNKQFLIKQKGKEDQLFNKQKEAVNYIIENFR